MPGRLALRPAALAVGAGEGEGFSMFFSIVIFVLSPSMLPPRAVKIKTPSTAERS